MIDAIVILPDHLHAIWSLPEGDADFATRWRHVKAMFSRALPMRERISESRLRKGERGIWQRRYWEHTLRDERDFSRHLDYIHFNPVKHGLVTRVEDWPYSSFYRMVRLGVYAKDWGGDASESGASFGERLWVSLRSTHPTRYMFTRNGIARPAASSCFHRRPWVRQLNNVGEPFAFPEYPVIVVRFKPAHRSQRVWQRSFSPRIDREHGLPFLFSQLPQICFREQ